MPAPADVVEVASEWAEGVEIAAMGAIAPVAVLPVEVDLPSEAAAQTGLPPPPATWSEAEPPVPTAAAAAPSEQKRNWVLRWIDGNLRYFDAMAILESFVAITSGILVWLGLWDLFTIHLLPSTLAAKLTLVAISLASLYSNRTLYDKQLILLRAKERARRSLSAGASTASVSRESSGMAVSTTMQPGAAQLAEQPSASGAALLLPDLRRAVGQQPITMPPDDQLPAQLPARMRRLYFDAPPFNLRRLCRAMFALFANLSLWIGMYDTLDYHLLPALFKACVTCEGPCALVKAGCIVLGLLGLYWTRALYGDVVIKSANFQRMA